MRELIVATVIFLSALAVAAEPLPAQPAPPGAIQLPKGFGHERLKGIDSHVGRIAKEGGLEISYDIGRMAGNYAGAIDPQEREWAIQQVVNGEPVEIVKSKDGRVTATFTKKFANFFAKVNREEDLATFLAIVLTYPTAAPGG